MIQTYIIFSLDVVNIYMYMAVFTRQVLSLEGPYTYIGFVGTCHGLMSFVWKPIAGSLSDKRGTTKILMFCLLANLLGTISTFASTSLILLFLSRLIVAFASPTQVLLRTIITNHKNENQSDNIAKLGIIGAGSFIVAALICGQLLEKPSGIQYIYGFMVLNIITNLILTTTLMFSTENPKPKKSQPTSPSLEVISGLKNLKKLATSETFWDIFIIKFVTTLSYAMLDTNTVIIFEYKGIRGKVFGYLISVMCLITIMVNVLLVKVNKTFYKNDIGYVRISHGSILLILSLLVAGFSSNIWTYVVFINIMISCRAIIDNSTMELLLKKLNNKDKATVMGSFDSVQSLTDFTAPILGSAILQYCGISCAYSVSAFLVAIGCSVVYRSKKSITGKKSQ